MSSTERPKTTADPHEPPPVLGSWRRLYAVVVATTVLVYMLLFLFSYLSAL